MVFGCSADFLCFASMLEIVPAKQESVEQLTGGNGEFLEEKRKDFPAISACLFIFSIGYPEQAPRTAL